VPLPRGLSWMLALCLAFCGRSRADEPPSVFLVRRGWHIDIGFFVPDLKPPLDRMAAEFPDARYVLFGFGDRRYLESSHHGPTTLLKALWPGEGVILSTGLRVAPEEAFGSSHVIRFQTMPAAYQATQLFVWNSFTPNQATLIGSGHAGVTGPYIGALYFAALARYSASHTCNTWAAETMQLSQPALHSKGVIFAGQLWRQARHQAAVD
jgi:hypothetical protein